MPALLAQFQDVLPVASPIFFDFGNPEFGKVLLPCWESVTVPEVAVDEDHQSLPREHDIGSAGE